jgi:ABC-2 type transport system permease protein
MATFFVVFTVLAAGMNGIVRERRQWTLQRLAVLPLRRSEILAGKILMQFSVGIIQFLIVFLVGLFVGVNFGRDPLALILVMVAYTLCITALGLALASRVDNENQVSALTTLLGLVMAALGGAWWPLSIVPPVMQAVGHLTPLAWAMDAFQQLFFYNGGLSDVLLPLAVLSAATVILFGLGILGFRFDR